MSNAEQPDGYARCIEYVREANTYAIRYLATECPERYARFVGEMGSEEAVVDAVVQHFRERTEGDLAFREIVKDWKPRAPIVEP